MPRSLSRRLALSLIGAATAAGKTKRVYPDVDDHTSAFIFSTDHVSAGNGARQADILGKGLASTRTTVNVMSMLNRNGIATAFQIQVNPAEPVFHSKLCTMRPYEVVVRKKVVKGSSYKKRHPETPDDHVFDEPRVEFYLKTTGMKWTGRSTGTEYMLTCDDPLMLVKEDGIHVHLPDVEFDAGKPIHIIPKEDIYDSDVATEEAEMAHMSVEAVKIFLIVEAAWKDAPDGGIVADFKLEFGKTFDGQIVLADVVDADSWRVQTFSGERLSKQPWREGCSDDEFLAILNKVVQITDFFPTYRYKRPAA